MCNKKLHATSSDDARGSKPTDVANVQGEDDSGGEEDQGRAAHALSPCNLLICVKVIGLYVDVDSINVSSQSERRNYPPYNPRRDQKQWYPTTEKKGSLNPRMIRRKMRAWGANEVGKFMIKR